MKLLFASMPFDGHFNPLTGLAAYLLGKGHEVRFYTGASFGPRLQKLGIPHLPYQRAIDVNGLNLTQHFPEYEKLGKGPKALEFAATKLFFGNLEAHYRDIKEIQASFPFEAFVCDGALYAAYPVRQKLTPHVYVVGPSPTPAPTSRTGPPPFFGLKPATNVFGRLRDAVVSRMVLGTMKKGQAMLNDLAAREGFAPFTGSIFDLPVVSAQVWFQTGCPGMDFPRDDFPPSYRFVGPLLPPRKPRSDAALPFAEKLARYDSLVVVSQGTVDNRDPEKLFVPTLEALKGGPHLVVVCTGHQHTEALRQRFPQDNVVVEDYVDFDVLLPHADAFVCNGGYGSIMQALVNGVPVLSAGELEGKNDINARLDYRRLGIDLKTERPTPEKISRGLARLLGDPSYAANVAKVRAELLSYQPFQLVEEEIVGRRAAEPTRKAS